MTSHYKEILSLGLPIAIGQIGIIILGFADTMMVGRYSTHALAASSFVTNLFTLVSFLIMGYSYGLTPLISALCGRGEHKAAGGLLKQAVTANVAFGAVLLAGMTVLYSFIHLMGQPEEILPLARPYYLVILLSMVFVVVFNVLRQFTDGTTDTRSAMWILLTGNALNILGNWLLIGGKGPFPELGLLGAGISTLLSRVYMAVALVVVVLTRRRYAPYRRGFCEARICRREVLRINAKSLPVSAQMGMETGSFTFSAIMAGWIGAVELASYQVLVTVGTLGFLFYYSFGAGMSIRLAAYAGRCDWEGVRRAARAGRNILLCMAVVSSLAFIVFDAALVSFFTTDAAVIATSLTLIAPLVFYQLGDSMQICFANALRGTGHVLPMMWIAFVSYLCVGIPVGFIMGFPLGFGLRGIFMAFSVGLFTAAALFWWQFRRVVGREELRAVAQRC